MGRAARADGGSDQGRRPSAGAVTPRSCDGVGFVADLLPLLDRLFPGRELLRSQCLRGGPRAVVHRLRLRGPDGVSEDVVVKQYLTAGEGYVREAAALAMLSPAAPVARLLTESSMPPAIAMRDVGEGASLADVLLAQDAERATQAVVAWAAAVGRLHAATRADRDRFIAELSARAGDLPVSADPMPALVTGLAEGLARLAHEADLDWPRLAGDELLQLAERLDVPDRSALSPTDTCPDNNVITSDGLFLLDFEGASYWHVAWDAAYLTVPWPSCWCAWRLPDHVTDAALCRYREVVRESLPYAATPDFDRDVATATMAWAFLSTAWFLRSAMTGDPPPSDPRIVAPRRQAMIVHRLAKAGSIASEAALPLLGEVARRWSTDLAARWAHASLSLAPAFQ